MNISKPQNRSLSQKFSDLPITRKTQLINLVSLLSFVGVAVGGAKVIDCNLRSQLENQSNQSYTALYQRDGNGKFTLTSSVERTIPSADPSLLTQAIKTKQAVSATETLNDQTYRLVAQPVPNPQGETNAVLVSGQPEIDLQRAINASLLLASLLGLVPLFAWWMSRAITQPIKRLQQTTTEWEAGQDQARATQESQDEVGQLATHFNQMADQIEQYNRHLQTQSEMLRFLSGFAKSESLDENRLDSMFNQALEEARQMIGAHRLLIYRFEPDRRGLVSHEARESSCKSALTQRIADPCIPKTLLAEYRQGRVCVINDVTQQPMNPAHQRLLQELQVKASVILPIRQGADLYGLLIAHQCDASREWQESEINFLKQLSHHFQFSLERLKADRQEKLESNLAIHLKDLTRNMALAKNHEDLYQGVVYQCRQAMQADRVIVYCFDANWHGTIIAESVDPLFPVALNARIGDPCFAERYVEKYRQGRVVATPDIYAANLTTCHLQQLEPFAVKANLVTPILVDNELFGLLIAHQCRGIRHWEATEIHFLTQMANQMGIALERFQLLKAQAVAVTQQQTEREQLQQRAIKLLLEVAPVRQGDLTIQATVSEDEIGTIADSYNAIIEQLRQIVTQVQSTTNQLAQTTNQSEQTIQSLSQQADQQVNEIESTVDRVERMMGSLEQVTSNAQQALVTVAKTLNQVESSEAVMNQTVEGMKAIQETVTQTVDKVSNLGESSKKISKVVSLISRFAAQTHLLALKASIEAARAGEEGRGFAVIADEVRVLAAQSAEASAEIEAIVDSIQRETREVAVTMATGTEQVVFGSQLLDQTRQTLTQIIAASQEIGQLVEAISQSAQQQSETGSSVRLTMNQVASISQKTLSCAQTMAHSIEHVLSTTQTLSSSVGQFKV